MNKQQKQVERITKEIKKKFQTGYGLNVVSVRTNNKFFYVYLKGCQEIANKRTELDLEKRMFEHKSGKIEGFTRKYKCHKLVYFEIYEDSYTAIAREKSIKNLVRSKKVDLIKSYNSQWDDLSAGILSPLAPE